MSRIFKIGILDQVLCFLVILSSSAYILQISLGYNFPLFSLFLFIAILFQLFKLAVYRTFPAKPREIGFLSILMLLLIADIAFLSLFSRESVDSIKGVGTVVFSFLILFYVMLISADLKQVKSIIRFNIAAVSLNAALGIAAFMVFIFSGFMMNLEGLRVLIPIDQRISLNVLMFSYYGDFKDIIIPRICGLLGDANLYALFISLFIPFIMAGIYDDYSNGRRGSGRLKACLLAVVLLAFFLSFSRSAYFGMVVSSIFFLYLLARKVGIPKFSLKMLFLFSLPLLFMVFVMNMNSYVMTRLTQVDLSYVDHMQLIWDSLGIFSNNLLGIGWNNFTVHFNEIRGLSLPYYQSHSMYLTLLVELGVQGLVLMLVLFFYPFVKLWKLLRSDSLGKREKLFISATLAGLVNIYFTNIFYSMFLQPYVWLFLGLSIAIANVYKEKEKVEDRD